jgi:hypothetical protein
MTNTGAVALQLWLSGVTSPNHQCEVGVKCAVLKRPGTSSEATAPYEE